MLSIAFFPITCARHRTLCPAKRAIFDSENAVAIRVVTIEPQWVDGRENVQDGGIGRYASDAAWLQRYDFAARVDLKSNSELSTGVLACPHIFIGVQSFRP
jgi:hypothetical protein